MKYQSLKGFIILLSLIITSNLLAQHSSIPRISKWLDDKNYLEMSMDEKGEREYYSVNAKSGKKKVYEDISVRSSIKEALPEGFRLGYNTETYGDYEKLLFVQDGDVFLFTSSNSEMKQLTKTDGLERNPTFSPDGNKMAFTREHDLYIFDFITEKEYRITDDGSKDVYTGYAAWVYFEEILGRGSKYRAFWWAPDSEKIAFLRFDEAEVPFFSLYRSDGSLAKDRIHGELETVHYPKPGDKNPIVRLGMYDMSSENKVWIKTDDKVDQYISFPSWTMDSKQLLYQVLNRDQDHLEFYMADPTNGSNKKIYDETRDTWVEFHADLKMLEDGSGFIIRSDKSDWKNLYYYDFEGKLIKQLTNLDWRVTRISKIDEKKKLIYFTGTGANSTESHLFSVKLDGSNFKQYTKGEGSHRTMISPKGTFIIDQWNGMKQAPKIELINAKGKQIKVIAETPAVEFDASKHSKSELFTIEVDGFNLPARWTLPVNFDKTKKYPIIFNIYSGPDAATVHNYYYGYDADYLAENGVITISVDHRASGHFGKVGMDFMHRNLGKWEMNDLSAAVVWLKTLPFIDENKIGISGHSYGGYTTCMALTYASEYFNFGVAGAPVTDWGLYDNVYTERFMDTPEQNPEGYKNGSVMNFVDQYHGALLLMHGEMDDNVHPQNTMQLISKLQDAGKDFEVFFYANGRHGWGGAKRQHSANETKQFWFKHLLNKEFNYMK